MARATSPSRYNDFTAKGKVSILFLPCSLLSSHEDSKDRQDLNLRDLRKNKMPARRVEPSHPIWAKFQNAALKGGNCSNSLVKTFTPFS
ncbi:MAG: hypothetical protein DWQ58_00990 [Microcystis aeruginosa TA09]|nr:MAG: hypothetical protein DWQ58_00990 [Microcystis aeruginosa TA09]